MPKSSRVLTEFLPDFPPANWYTDEMEVQVMVAQGDGEPVEGKTGVYTDGLNTWYNFRIPKNANTDPIDNDHDLRYPLERYADGIGMTGWNWKRRCSVRVGFDFDAITGHAPGVGISDDQLDTIRQKLMEIPEALVLRSTSGTGLHLYLEFDPDNLPVTLNHTEHATLAIACLKLISQRVGFDFQAGLDVGGGVLWAWHVKATPENQGLTVIKERTAYFVPPDDWRSCVRPKPSALPDRGEPVAMESIHKEIVADLQRVCPQFPTYRDGNRIVTHTYALKLYFAHRTQEGKPLLGVYDTLSQGTDSKPNCYMYVVEGGGFLVYRFGLGTTEHDTWYKSANGWTATQYNCVTTFKAAGDFFGGVAETADSFSFSTADNANRALRSMGIDSVVSLDRPTILKKHSNRIVVAVPVERTDPDTIDGWIRKGKKWIRSFTIPSHPSQLSRCDDAIRKVIRGDDNAGIWYARHRNGSWMVISPTDTAKLFLDLGVDTHTQAELIRNSWRAVNLPFQPEYPGNRQWNLGAAQLAFEPSGADTPHHPHWDKVLKHCFAELNEYLPNLEWARNEGITTGYQYGMTWIATVLRRPFDPLPYLYPWGAQNSGKSILHEAIGLLITRGVVRADNALTGTFNGELANAILCVVEEVDVSKDIALNRMKDWTVSPVIQIHGKNAKPYDQPNTTHWIQTSNNRAYCPVVLGDNRVTSLHVPLSWDDHNPMIPKMELLDHLRAEAPDFLTTLMRVNLPDTKYDRLSLPAVDTGSKHELMMMNASPLERFVNEWSTSCKDEHDQPHIVKYTFSPDAEARIERDTLWNDFQVWYLDEYGCSFSRNKLIRNLPDGCKRTHTKSTVYIEGIKRIMKPVHCAHSWRYSA